LSGSSSTVKQTTRKLIPSERLNSALGDWDASLWSLPVGQAGDIASSHYSDQWSAYSVGRAFPMQFRKVDVKSVVTFVPAR
jgi:acyl-homoserine lactone acylase PvdQ